MKKYRILSFLLIFCLAFALPVSAEADGVVFNICPPAELPKAGETFEVSVEISNNPGFGAIQFTLSYDSKTMKCENITTGDVLKDVVSITEPEGDEGAVVAGATLKPVSRDGVVAVFSFVLNKDISEFRFKLSDIVLTDADAKDIKCRVTGASDNLSEYDFPDISGHWAEAFAYKAAQNGLFIGGADGNFYPDDNVTRAQFITVLWRMAGKEVVDVKTPFADIENQIEEFQQAIAWGYAKGYINGTSETAFDPEAFITRESAMKILHAYSGGKVGTETYFYPVYDGAFKDSSQISPWARASVYWGIYNKLISGISEDILLPQGNATRAQLAKILVNYLDIE